MSLLELLPALFATAAAIGLSPYAALACPGLAAYLGLVSLPTPLAGLASPVVWATLLLLAALQGGLARLRTADLVSGTLHTLVSPLAAALFVSVPMPTPRGLGAWAATVAATVIALLVHTFVLSVHARAWTAGPTRRVGAFQALQLLAAAALGALAWLAAPYALAWTVLLVLAPLPWLPGIVGAASLPVRALLEMLRRPARTSRWRPGIGALPRGLRPLAEDALTRAGASLRNVRAGPVTLARRGPRWPYVRGWVVQEESLVPLFVYRRGWRRGVVALTPGPGGVDEGLLVETLEVGGSDPYAVCVDPGGPAAPAILAAIERAVWGWEPGTGAAV